ncbi:FUN14 domain-containing protein 1-like [Schistocerca americana]|uniref:FUN14 domain-containing protein 1-like n=1 Tax=Schistocerca americana TaxID=7009 RepID=UPI001F4F3C9E|nr:FUN14 domain-containing protein 1-like [Schistocerca americana]
MDEVSRETKSIVDKVLKDVGKASAAKQLVIGTVSGWCTGFVTMKVGKAAAVAVGGGIILLQIANHKGYLKINWDKVHKEVDKLADKVEEKATGDGPKFLDKVERLVDRNIDKAEELLKNKQRKAKHWYHSFIGDEDYFQVQEIHIFLASFVLGFSVGILTAS